MYKLRQRTKRIKVIIIKVLYQVIFQLVNSMNLFNNFTLLVITSNKIRKSITEQTCETKPPLDIKQQNPTEVSHADLAKLISITLSMTLAVKDEKKVE